MPAKYHGRVHVAAFGAAAANRVKRILLGLVSFAEMVVENDSATGFGRKPVNVVE